ncbi:MAG: hypothetical protein HRT36_07500 [Alphaproteobacteria bacterium]|nr:hypothetical protein [Alphaproteobacteria bacterium]
MSIHCVQVLLPLAAAAVLSGCIFGVSAGSVVSASLIGTQTSLSFTKKLPTDHIAELITDLDCDYMRSLEDGGYLCRPKNSQIVEAPVYCYRTLGRVDCYRQPQLSENVRLVE